MENSTKEQPSPLVTEAKSSSRLLRYPLRSASKSKEEKQSATDSSNSSASRRGRPASSVSKSVSVLQVSDKDKPAKPPRRLSTPSKSSASPASKAIGTITPISEVRAKRSANYQVKSETPLSDTSKSFNRRKFSDLSSASYWLAQIKLSETTAKHSISFGFFKLALEAGCEPLQRMTDELKSYARRHNLVQLEESVKELFEIYNISEEFELLQVSDTSSQKSEEGTRSSDDDVHSSSIVSAQSLKPKSCNTNAVESSPVNEPVRETAKKGLKPKSLNAGAVETPPVKGPVKEIAQKSNSVTRSRVSMNKNSTNTRSTYGAVGRNTQKATQKPNKQATDKDNVKKKGVQSALEEVAANPIRTQETVQENKENMDATQMEEIGFIDVPTSI